MNEYTQHNKNILNKHFTELNPLAAGWQICCPSYRFGPTKRDFYLIHYVVSGMGVFTNRNGAHTVGAGQYFLIRPGELTVYEADARTPWQYIWIGFNGSLAPHFNALPDTGNFLDERLFLDIKYTDDDHSRYEELLTGKLFLLYAQMFCHEKGETKRVYRVKNIVERNYMSDLSVESLAENLGVNRIYLSRIFKEEFGMSIKQYIVSVRMSHAKDFLESGYSVAAVADMVGYADSFSFSKMFKSHFGITPLRVKKSR